MMPAKLQLLFVLGSNLTLNFTQRPYKVPILYRDKLNTLLKDLEVCNIIKRIGSSPPNKPVYGTTDLNPLTNRPKGDTKNVY